MPCEGISVPKGDLGALGGSGELSNSGNTRGSSLFLGPLWSFPQPAHLFSLLTGASLLPFISTGPTQVEGSLKNRACSIGHWAWLDGRDSPGGQKWAP